MTRYYGVLFTHKGGKLLGLFTSEEEVPKGKIHPFLEGEGFEDVVIKGFQELNKRGYDNLKSHMELTEAAKSIKDLTKYLKKVKELIR